MSVAGAKKRIAKKAYYSIGEVCEITGLKPHVLRYWETQFDVLHPNKNRAGNRVYKPGDVEVVLLVRHLLYEQKFTIEGARKRLREVRKSGALRDESKKVAGPGVIIGVQDDLTELREVLSLDIPLPDLVDEEAEEA